MPVGLITGASRGLGLALTSALSNQGWQLIVDARDGVVLKNAMILAGPGRIVTIEGDVTEFGHRKALAQMVQELGPLDLLVNNASDLGVSPLPALRSYPLDELRRVFETNVLAPLALAQLLLPSLRRAEGTIVNVSSDAAVEAYEGWGGYGSSKAALDLISAVMAAEEQQVRIYAFDPGDMRTAMHQLAFPGEDISDRPEPETIVPVLLDLIKSRVPSGRYRASDLLQPATTS